MIAITVTGIPQTVSRLERASLEYEKANRQSVARGGLLLQRMLRARTRAPGGRDAFWGKTSPYGFALAGRTGKTAQRIVAGPVLVQGFFGQTATVAVGSPDQHLAFHEKGGTITGNRFLRIPTGAAQTAAGADINAGRSVRGLPGYHLIRTKQGKLWIVREAGGKRSRRIEFMYLLKRSVKLRPWMIFAITRVEAEPLIAADTRLAMGEVTRRANG